MIQTIIHLCLSWVCWTTLGSSGPVALPGSAIPDGMSLVMGIGVLLGGLASVGLLIHLPSVLAQARRRRKERVEREERAAAARAHSNFLLIQEQTTRRMQQVQQRRAILRGVAAGLEAFCEQWDAAHPEEQEASDAHGPD